MPRPVTPLPLRRLAAVLVAWIACGWLWPAFALAEVAGTTGGADIIAPTPSPSEPEAKPEPVRVGTEVVFLVSRSRPPDTVQQRARRIATALESAAGVIGPEQVRVEWSGDTAAIYAGDLPIVELDAEDAHAHGAATLVVYTNATAHRIRAFLQEEQARNVLASRVLNVSIVVCSGLLALLLVRRMGHGAQRIREVARSHPERLPGLRLRGMELLGPAATRAGILIGVGLGVLVAQLSLVYGWLVMSLSLFPSTEAYRASLSAAVLDPLARLASRMLNAFPVVLAALMGGMLVIVLLRAVEQTLRAVERGELVIHGLSPDLAGATSRLVRTGLVTGALVFVAPLVTGNRDGGLAMVGIVALVGLGLAAVPLLATAAVGIALTLVRTVKVGAELEIAGRRGTVTEVGLFHVRLQDGEGNVTHVPYLLLLLHPMRASARADSDDEGEQ